MSYHDYEQSKTIVSAHYSFAALVMAAMRQADTFNAAALQRAFPDMWRELQQRYNAPGGKLPEEIKKGEICNLN